MKRGCSRGDQDDDGDDNGYDGYADYGDDSLSCTICKGVRNS